MKVLELSNRTGAWRMKVLELSNRTGGRRTL